MLRVVPAAELPHHDIPHLDLKYSDLLPRRTLADIAASVCLSYVAPSHSSLLSEVRVIPLLPLACQVDAVLGLVGSAPSLLSMPSSMTSWYAGTRVVYDVRRAAVGVPSVRARSGPACREEETRGRPPCHPTAQTRTS